MITAIEKIEKYGIYEKYVKDDSLPDFKRYNLIYGWNGSGKSTLSNLLRDIEKKKLNKLYSDASFTINTTDQGEIHQSNFTNNKMNIRVFNENFIKENIDWNNKINSILLMSKKRIEDIEKLDNDRKSYDNNIGKYSTDLELNEKTYRQNEKLLTTLASEVRTSFGLVDNNDTKYSKYNKANLRKMKDFYGNISNAEANILAKEEVDRLVKMTKPIKKNLINKIPYLNDTSEITKNYTTICKEKVVAKVIQDLVEDNSLSRWAQDGIEIHRGRGSCVFCGSKISSERIELLEHHFNDDIKQLQKKGEELIVQLNSIIDYEINLPTPHIFYEELSDDYYQNLVEIMTIDDLFKELATAMIKDIEKKIGNPFEIVDIRSTELEVFSEKINVKLKFINEIIRSHNDKTNRFNEIVSQSLHKLEMHFSAQVLTKSTYFADDRKYIAEDKRLIHESEKLNALKGSIDKLTKELSNESIGANQFNEKLSQFLGYNEIQLVFSKKKMGYEIIRVNEKRVASHLSEGEKTAIAFIYFIIKIGENNNDIADTILIIDDPVSSFDSNKLFHSYAFLRNETENAKQLIVLTHNFSYYQLVRSWLCKDLKIQNNQFIVNNYFEDNIRLAKLKEAPKSMNKSSEYDFIFSELYSYSKKVDVTNIEAYYIANIARKLVESFLSFKFPKQRNNLKNLLRKGLGEDTLKIEKMYKFLNVHSHSQKIDFFECPEGNMMSESKSIILDVFKMIESLDKTHYDHMIESF